MSTAREVLKAYHRILVTEAGEGPGNWGHAGRPGEVGGSGPGGGGGGGGDSGVKGTGRHDSTDSWEKSLTSEQKVAMNSWMDVGYEGIRGVDKGIVSSLPQYKVNLDALKEALKTAPLYTAEIHRGIRMDVPCSIGDSIQMNAISSFSTNRAVAKGFAVTSSTTGKDISNKQKFTILSIVKHNGAPRLPMKAVGGTFEMEVVMEKGRTFKVTRIEKMEIKRPGGKVWKGKQVFLEEG